MDPTRTRRSLVGLNIALLLLLAAVALAPRSHAQRGTRARGQYTMVSGRITGGSVHAVYIVDAANQDVLVARWNESAKAIDTIGYRDLQADAQASPGR